ncbi:MAG: hypothetical protein UY03_C0001G0008 [Parcubacteria group bacterium GW2011_GWA2_47_64]|nr:MAG: hypothetical protein UY03_C0001G0008 [Parcubacteria group bacterium GW2011_GWA2_47_64]KKU95727.1 MAG: hypothetical protein UY29_C0020G0008 [Parcubacteria group bacterium GW2011_GWC2_48_17]
MLKFKSDTAEGINPGVATIAPYAQAQDIRMSGVCSAVIPHFF